MEVNCQVTRKSWCLSLGLGWGAVGEGGVGRKKDVKALNGILQCYN